MPELSTSATNHQSESKGHMRKSTRLLLGALSATVILAVAVGAASARRIELSEQHFLAAWTELIFEEGGARVNCEVTLEGSFHSRTLSKVCGQLIGYITEAIVHHPCKTPEGWALNGTEVIGGVTVRQTLPWHILFISFSGTLPRITSIRVSLRNASFLVENFGVSCLYRTSETEPAFGNIGVEAGGAVTGLESDETARIRKTSGGLLCPGTGRLIGRARVGRQPEIREGEWRPIIVRLVQ